MATYELYRCEVDQTKGVLSGHKNVWVKKTTILRPKGSSEPKINFPKLPKPGDHLVLHGPPATPHVIHLPAHKYGHNPVIFFKDEGEWQWMIETESIKYHEELKGEDAVISKTLQEGDNGDVLVGRRHGNRYRWELVSQTGHKLTIIAEDAVVFDDPQGIDMDQALQTHFGLDKIDSKTLSKAEKEVVKLVRVQQRINELNIEFLNSSVRLDVSASEKIKSVLKFVADNLAPGPVAGTTIPLELAALVGDVAYVQAACAPGANVMTSQFTSEKPNAGFPGTNAAIAFLHAIGSAYTFGAKIHDLHKNANSMSRGAKKAEGTDIAAAGAKMLKGLLDGIMGAINAAGNVIPQGAAPAVSAGTAGASGSVGILIGGLAAVRSFRKVHRARMRLNEIKELRNTPALLEDFKGCVEYAAEKLVRRQGKQVVTGISATIGVAGGTVLMVTAIVGVANAWNPVGWAIVGAGAIVGIAIAGYLVYRRYRRDMNRQEARRQHGVGTPAELADKLIEIATNEAHLNCDAAYSFLFLMGADYPVHLLKNHRGEITEEIKRHFHG